MKRRSNSSVSSSTGPSNIPTARNRQQRQQQEEAQLRLSQIRGNSRTVSPAPSSASKIASRSATPTDRNTTDTTNSTLRGLPSTTKTTNQPLTVTPNKGTKTNATTRTPLSTLTKQLSSVMTLLSPAEPITRPTTPSSGTTNSRGRSVQRTNTTVAVNSSSKHKNNYTPPDYGIASLSANPSGASRSVSREPVRTLTPNKRTTTTPKSNTKLPAPLPAENESSSFSSDEDNRITTNNGKRVSSATKSAPEIDEVTTTTTNVSTMGNTLTNIMELLFSPSKSKPAQPLSLPANSYTIRSSWNTTRRAPPLNPQEFTAASYPTVPNAGKGAYINVTDNTNNGKRNRAGSQTVSTSASATDSNGNNNNRPMLGPRAKLMPGKTISRMQLIKGRLVRVTFLGVSFALAFLAWGQILERIMNKSFICYPANSILEPICLSPSLCLATNEYQNYTLPDNSTVRVSECAYYECLSSSLNSYYRTIGIRIPSIVSSTVVPTTPEAVEVTKGMVTSVHDVVPTTADVSFFSSSSSSSSSETETGSLCTLQIQSSWYELFSYRILILPAEFIRFIISMLMPTFALRSGGLIETGYIVGMVIAFAME